MNRIESVPLQTQRGLVRVKLRLGYEVLHVYAETGALIVDVRVDDRLPEIDVTLYVGHSMQGELPEFCGAHLGSVSGRTLGFASGTFHLFEVNPRSPEAFGP